MKTHLIIIDDYGYINIPKMRQCIFFADWTYNKELAGHLETTPEEFETYLKNDFKETYEHYLEEVDSCERSKEYAFQEMDYVLDRPNSLANKDIVREFLQNFLGKNN